MKTTHYLVTVNGIGKVIPKKSLKSYLKKKGYKPRTKKKGETQYYYGKTKVNIMKLDKIGLKLLKILFQRKK